MTVSSSPALVGREREAARLRDALSEVSTAGEPRLVVLSGPAGVGCSALAADLVAAARADGLPSVVAVHGPCGGPACGLDLEAVRLAAAAGPVVVWLDDLQWGADALTFAIQTLRSRKLPILFVGTVQTGGCGVESLTVGNGRAVDFRIRTTSASVRFGAADSISATAPATIGVAKLVPRLRWFRPSE